MKATPNPSTGEKVPPVYAELDERCPVCGNELEIGGGCEGEEWMQCPECGYS